MLEDWLFLAGGFALLYTGAEGLIRGSVRLSLRLGISPLVIGLTVVAFGTSTPELFVSLRAAWANSGDIVAGNLIGSNIFNLAAILGLAALLHPIRVQSQLIAQDIPVMIGGTALFYACALDRTLDRMEGLILSGFLLVYILLTIHAARRGDEMELTDHIEDQLPEKRGAWWADLLWIIGGIGLLSIGSNLLVSGATSLARHAGVSEAVIGLTIVAAGTGLPELATSVLAAIKKESDLAIGNVVGSNVFNLLGIGGAVSAVHPFRFTDIEIFDLWIMLALSFLILPLGWTGRRIGRREGALLLAAYGAYLYFIWPVPH